MPRTRRSHPDRRISFRDDLLVFLRRHYEELAPLLAERPSGDLVIDTAAVGVETAAAAVVERALGG